MKLKPAFIYQLNDCKKSIIAYYLTLASLIIISIVIMAVHWFGSRGNGVVSFGGIDFATAIFLFVVGLNSFKELYFFLTQNGISRKTLFVSRLLAFAATAAGMAVIDRLVSLVLAYTASLEVGITVSSVFNQIYNITGITAMSLLYSILLNMLALMAGYFLTILFYRLNKLGKVAVGAGVPVFFMIVLPVFDTFVTHNQISRAIQRVMYAIFQPMLVHPWYAALIFAVGTALLALFSWLLMRRAIVKK